MAGSNTSYPAAGRRGQLERRGQHAVGPPATRITRAKVPRSTYRYLPLGTATQGEGLLGVPDDEGVEREPDRAELVLLAFAVGLAQLALPVSCPSSSGFLNSGTS